MAAIPELLGILGEFETAMLVTHAPGGGLHARPMAVARTSGEGDLLFVTGVESTKVHEIQDDAHVAATFQSADRYVSVVGTARIERDRGTLNEVWREDWRAWFPDGRDDPRLRLIRVKTQSAETWDASGKSGRKFVFDEGRARGTGERR